VKRDNYIFIKNRENYAILENILSASKEYCQKDSISLNLVGNVELIGRNVFKTFNAVYQSNKIGMAYSNFYHYNDSTEKSLKVPRQKIKKLASQI
jgi:hypothetical protein